MVVGVGNGVSEDVPETVWECVEDCGAVTHSVGEPMQVLQVLSSSGVGVGCSCGRQ